VKLSTHYESFFPNFRRYFPKVLVRGTEQEMAKISIHQLAAISMFSVMVFMWLGSIKEHADGEMPEALRKSGGIEKAGDRHGFGGQSAATPTPPRTPAPPTPEPPTPEPPTPEPPTPEPPTPEPPTPEPPTPDPPTPAPITPDPPTPMPTTSAPPTPEPTTQTPAPGTKAVGGAAALKVAVCVLLTHSDRTPNMAPTVDGIGVLRHSIERVNPNHPIDYIVIVTPSVPKKWFPILKNFGWIVREEKNPIEAHEIQNKRIADEVTRDGAMGISEMVKLVVLTWHQYDTILFIDADVSFHKNFNELFDVPASLGWTMGGWESEKINGGFLVFRPNYGNGTQHFVNMIEILREGDFRPGSGWRGSGIGWTYGGRTIQGILPYYYFKVLNGTQDYKLERCRYNNMVQLPRCKAWPEDNVTSNHFTGDCLKPWQCPGTSHPLCKSLTEKWWVMAKELKKKWGKETADDVMVCKPGQGYYSLATQLL
jgi:hypothetical protein